MSVPGVVDSHCHLLPRGDGPRREADALLDDARAAGVVGFVVVGVGKTQQEARDAVALAGRHSDVVAAVGVHPHDASGCDDRVFDEIAILASHPRVTAVGEIGLDFHYDHSPREVQRAVFRRFVALARSVQKPIVIHTREAGQECLAILEEEGARDVGGVIHCFSEDRAFATRALDLGFALSFSGILTFKGARAIHEVAQVVPGDRMLVETDAPYLAPVPLRGKICEPRMVLHTARRLAELRGEAYEEVARQTTENARAIFGLGAL